jgi:hypothetical protein
VIDEFLQHRLLVFCEVFALSALQAFGHRRHHRIGIKLTMRMVQRHADFDATIFEGQYVLDARNVSELAGTVAPRLY